MIIAAIDVGSARNFRLVAGRDWIRWEAFVWLGRRHLGSPLSRRRDQRPFVSVPLQTEGGVGQEPGSRAGTVVGDPELHGLLDLRPTDPHRGLPEAPPVSTSSSSSGRGLGMTAHPHLATPLVSVASVKVGSVSVSLERRSPTANSLSSGEAPAPDAPGR